MTDGYSEEDYKVYQQFDSTTGWWESRITKAGHHVRTIYTFTQWGGRRKAKRIIAQRILRGYE